MNSPNKEIAAAAQAVAKKTRRTQKERREETIRKLFDATRDSLIEVGYSSTSIQQICKRSGVSHGGLFRHFKSRIDLMIAVAGDLSDSLIDMYQEQFGDFSAHEDPFYDALVLLRENHRSLENQAFLELIMAGRSDEVLRVALEPIIAHVRKRTLDAAKRMFADLSDMPNFPYFVDCIIYQFHGETLNNFVLKDEQEDERRLLMAKSMIEAYLAQHS